MAIAKNGAAIIGDVVVPASEVLVLKALVELGRPATVPEIATAMNDTMSDASLYSLLGRLDERRRLVARQAVVFEVQGTKLRRILWSVLQTATDFISQNYGNPSEKARSVAGAPVQMG